MELPTGGSKYSSPVLENVNGIDTVYFPTSMGSDFLVTALRADNGDPVWTNASVSGVPGFNYFALNPADDNWFTTPVIANAQYLYVIMRGKIGLPNGYLYKLDASDGTFIWEYEFDTWCFSSPAYKNNVLYVGCNDGYMYAIRDNGLSASQEWKSADQYGEAGTVKFSNYKPIIFGNFIFTGSYSGFGEHIKILNIADGTSYQSIPPGYFSLQAGSAMALETVTGKMEVYFNNGAYLLMMKENKRPRVFDVVFTDTLLNPITSVSPGETFGVTAFVDDEDSNDAQGCMNNTNLNTIYKYPDTYPDLDKRGKWAVTLDHSAVSGASATDTFLFSNYDPIDPPCDYENDGDDDDPPRSITVALGTPTGRLLPLR